MTVAPAPAPDGILRPHPTQPGRGEAVLPAPDVQSHAASLTALPGGDLGCVWFSGSQEGMADISVHFSRLPAGSGRWTAPVRLSGDPDRSEQNPVLFPAPDGGLWLLHTAQRAGNQDTSEVRLRVSRDGGVTWGPVRSLFPADDRGGVFVRQPLVVLGSGRWLLPVFRCPVTPGARWTGGLDTSAVMLSDDQGLTWREHPVPGSTGRVHMNVHPRPDGTLLALFRSRTADRVYRSVSQDEGETWSVPEPTTAPNNNSSLQYVPLGDGRLAMVHNHASAADATERRTSLYDEIEEDAAGPAPAAGDDLAFWGAPRAPLTLSLSTDSGRTWPARHDLVTGDGHCLTNNSREGLNRELSYPTLTRTPGGVLHIAYTHHRRTIRHLRLDPEWLDRYLPRP
ncbi:sialidase family protein [Streptomyces sp. CRN 30]|uniref:sialidase family protein n=1 Tax=Streptomyces sp. CRN 30 TaxID=3075613 RepID=UPI002A826ED5|nr:exo-alpha-sialidase [Streptomyces sp. CRN 30]